MSSSGSVEAPVLAPLVAEPSSESRTLKASAHEQSDWLCAFCYYGVARDADRLRVDGRDEFTFRNPEGYTFHLITFATASGCRPSGIPTLEHTWFPGCAWTYAHCAQCGRHLGWFYTGQNSFVGLIKTRLVCAAHLRN